MTIETKY